MGDRGNIAIQYNGDKSKRVYFYTHRSGYNLDAIVASALERGKDRWSDDQYLARIIFCELVKDDVEGITGYGIGLEPDDNEYPFLVIDLKSQTVFREADDREGFTHIGPPKKSAAKPLSFEKFIAKHKADAVPA